jgi:hypothetical protein
MNDSEDRCIGDQVTGDTRSTPRGLVIAFLDTAALIALAPNWSKIHACLANPARWITRCGLDAAAVELAGLVLWLLAVWTAAGLITVTLSRLPGYCGRGCLRLAQLVLPIWSRRYFAVLTGLTLALTPLEVSAASALAPHIAVVKALTAIPVNTSTTSIPPDSPTWPLDVPSPKQDHPDDRSRAEVVVRPGDSLWLISARHISLDGNAHADSGDILTECHRWYETNAEVIGASPALIRPGQHLRVPQPLAGSTEPPVWPTS